MRPSAEVQFMKLLRDCQRNPGNRVSFTGVVEVYTREGQFIGTIETTADDIARKERNNKHHPKKRKMNGSRSGKKRMRNLMKLSGST